MPLGARGEKWRMLPLIRILAELVELAFLIGVVYQASIDALLGRHAEELFWLQVTVGGDASWGGVREPCALGIEEARWNSESTVPI